MCDHTHTLLWTLETFSNLFYIFLKFLIYNKLNIPSQLWFLFFWLEPNRFISGPLVWSDTSYLLVYLYWHLQQLIDWLYERRNTLQSCYNCWCCIVCPPEGTLQPLWWEHAYWELIWAELGKTWASKLITTHNKWSQWVCQCIGISYFLHQQISVWNISWTLAETRSSIQVPFHSCLFFSKYQVKNSGHVMT